MKDSSSAISERIDRTPELVPQFVGLRLLESAFSYGDMYHNVVVGLARRIPVLERIWTHLHAPSLLLNHLTPKISSQPMARALPLAGRHRRW